MKPVARWWVATALIAAAAVAIAAWRVTEAESPKSDGEPAPPTAEITVAPVRAGAVLETVEGFGVLTGSAESIRTLAASRAVVVDRILVTPGASVSAGAPLIEIASAPASTQAYRLAADAVTFARRDLERTQRLLAARLAANDQLSAAEKTLADAQGALAAETAAGAGLARQTLRAPFAAVVTAVPAAAGDHMAADAPLITLTGGADRVARLAIEPGRAARLAPGQAVTLAGVFGPGPPFESRLTVVGRQIDPVSRMIIALAPVTGGQLPLGEAVRGKILVASHPGLLVPRAAVVVDEDGAHVFVIAGGRARRVAVTAGPEVGDEIAVEGEVRAGNPVALEGAYELRDGMAVRAATR
jgi:RND family efflux transporter MFP subunit